MYRSGFSLTTSTRDTVSFSKEPLYSRRPWKTERKSRREATSCGNFALCDVTKGSSTPEPFISYHTLLTHHPCLLNYKVIIMRLKKKEYRKTVTGTLKLSTETLQDSRKTWQESWLMFANEPVTLSRSRRPHSRCLNPWPLARPTDKTRHPTPPPFGKCFLCAFYLVEPRGCEDIRASVVLARAECGASGWRRFRATGRRRRGRRSLAEAMVLKGEGKPKACLQGGARGVAAGSIVYFFCLVLFCFFFHFPARFISHAFIFWCIFFFFCFLFLPGFFCCFHLSFLSSWTEMENRCSDPRGGWPTAMKWECEDTFSAIKQQLFFSSPLFAASAENHQRCSAIKRPGLIVITSFLRSLASRRRPSPPHQRQAQVV